MTARALHANRIAGWLLAMTLVLPSLIGWLPMPMRAQAAMHTAAGNVQSATERLLADLAVLCTPYGLRLMGQDKPGKPTGKLAHDSCVLCGIAAGASVGVLQQTVLLFVPERLQAPVSDSAPGLAPPQTIDLRPPSRGPPN